MVQMQLQQLVASLASSLKNSAAILQQVFEDGHKVHPFPFLLTNGHEVGMQSDLRICRQTIREAARRGI